MGDIYALREHCLDEQQGTYEVASTGIPRDEELDTILLAMELTPRERESARQNEWNQDWR